MNKLLNKVGGSGHKILGAKTKILFSTASDSLAFNLKCFSRSCYAKHFVRETEEKLNVSPKS